MVQNFVVFVWLTLETIRNEEKHKNLSNHTRSHLGLGWNVVGEYWSES